MGGRGRDVDMYGVITDRWQQSGMAVTVGDQPPTRDSVKNPPPIGRVQGRPTCAHDTRYGLFQTKLDEGCQFALQSRIEAVRKRPLDIREPEGTQPWRPTESLGLAVSA